jgi:hypothetical protein
MAFYSNSKWFICFCLLVLSFWGCKDKVAEKQESVTEEKAYVMYQPSEMASFMNAMYAYNQKIKQQIIAGETPTNLPLDLMELHSAEMTAGKSRTPVWNSFVNVFIDSQKAVLDTLSNIELKERYNSAITNCLSCHKTECVGPIPKIKKLLIQ